MEIDSSLAPLPLTWGDAAKCFSLVSASVQAIHGRLAVLETGAVQGKGAASLGKPRVRVPAGQTFETKAYGGTYETTDGITFRLKAP